MFKYWQSKSLLLKLLKNFVSKNPAKLVLGCLFLEFFCLYIVRKGIQFHCVLSPISSITWASKFFFHLYAYSSVLRRSYTSQRRYSSEVVIPPVDVREVFLKHWKWKNTYNINRKMLVTELLFSISLGFSANLSKCIYHKGMLRQKFWWNTGMPCW